MARNTGKKIALGVGVAGAITGGLIWALRKADAAEAAAGKYKAAAESASAAARSAAGREAAALAVAGRESAAAAQARSQAAAAGAAVAAANNAAARATTAAAQAEARAAGARALAEQQRALAEASSRALAAQAAQAAAARENVQKQAATQQAANAVQAVENVEAILERKRQIIASGFQAVVDAVKRKNPGMSQQQAVNTAAAFMKSRGINLDKPDPTLAFWKKNENELLALVTAAVNSYLTLPAAASQTPGIKPAPQHTSVKTVVDQAKASFVEDAWARAIAYAIDEYKQKKNKIIEPPQAYALIATAFQRGSVLSPGAAAVPVPSAIQSPSAFWANPQAIVQMAANAAVDAAKREIDYRTSDPALAGAFSFV